MNQIFSSIELFIFDIDGTLLLDSTPIKLAKEVLELLIEKKRKFVIISNNSSYSTEENLFRLQRVLEVPLSFENIFTSNLATIHYLLKNNYTKCFIIGTPSMLEEFKNKGIRHTEEDPEAIILGFDRTLTYEKIQKAAIFLQEKGNIPFFATHPDDTCPTRIGRIPDVGSFLKMFEQATNRRPEKIFGKPSKYIIEPVLKRISVTPSKVLIVGDRIETDIKMAKHVGALSALVLTGETKREEVQQHSINPDFIWDNLKELHSYLLE
ncbi:MAG: HAD-IIA family hydrolase [Candidatus Heimdallarchaeaceae archaeon]